MTSQSFLCHDYSMMWDNMQEKTAFRIGQSVKNILVFRGDRNGKSAARWCYCSQHHECDDLSTYIKSADQLPELTKRLIVYFAEQGAKLRMEREKAGE